MPPVTENAMPSQATQQSSGATRYTGSGLQGLQPPGKLAVETPVPPVTQERVTLGRAFALAMNQTPAVVAPEATLVNTPTGTPRFTPPPRENNPPSEVAKVLNCCDPKKAVNEQKTPPPKDLSQKEQGSTLGKTLGDCCSKPVAHSPHTANTVQIGESNSANTSLGAGAHTSSTSQSLSTQTATSQVSNAPTSSQQGVPTTTSAPQSALGSSLASPTSTLGSTPGINSPHGLSTPSHSSALSSSPTMFGAAPSSLVSTSSSGDLGSSRSSWNSTTSSSPQGEPSYKSTWSEKPWSTQEAIKSPHTPPPLVETRTDVSSYSTPQVTVPTTPLPLPSQRNGERPPQVSISSPQRATSASPQTKNTSLAYSSRVPTERSLEPHASLLALRERSKALLASAKREMNSYVTKITETLSRQAHALQQRLVRTIPHSLSRTLRMLTTIREGAFSLKGLAQLTKSQFGPQLTRYLQRFSQILATDPKMLRKVLSHLSSLLRTTNTKAHNIKDILGILRAIPKSERRDLLRLIAREQSSKDFRLFARTALALLLQERLRAMMARLSRRSITIDWNARLAERLRRRFSSSLQELELMFSSLHESSTLRGDDYEEYFAKNSSPRLTRRARRAHIRERKGIQRVLSTQSDTVSSKTEAHLKVTQKPSSQKDIRTGGDLTINLHTGNIIRSTQAAPAKTLDTGMSKEEDDSSREENAYVHIG